MKKIPILLSGFITFAVASCANNQRQQVQTLPPVVKKASETPKKRTYTAKKKSYPKPKASTATTLTDTPSALNPLIPDPIKANPVTEIPRFEVPANLQPKVADGINQGLFIELKW